MKYTVTGVKYFYDNNKTGKCLFTDEGFSVATAINYLYQKETNITVDVYSENAADGMFSNSYYYYGFAPSFSVEEGKMYIGEKNFQNVFKNGYNVDINFSSNYYKYDYYYGSSQQQMTFSKKFDKSYLTDKKPETEYFGEIVIPRTKNGNLPVIMEFL